MLPFCKNFSDPLHFCKWDVAVCKLLIRLKVEISIDLPPSISEREEVKLQFSGLYMALSMH